MPTAATATLNLPISLASPQTPQRLGLFNGPIPSWPSPHEFWSKEQPSSLASSALFLDSQTPSPLIRQPVEGVQQSGSNFIEQTIDPQLMVDHIDELVSMEQISEEPQNQEDVARNFEEDEEGTQRSSSEEGDGDPRSSPISIASKRRRERASMKKPIHQLVEGAMKGRKAYSMWLFKYSRVLVPDESTLEIPRTSPLRPVLTESATANKRFKREMDVVISRVKTMFFFFNRYESYNFTVRAYL